jgi:hypothetical protein
MNKMHDAGHIKLSWEKDAEGFTADIAGTNSDMLFVMSTHFPAMIIEELAAGRLKPRGIRALYARALAGLGAGIVSQHPELLMEPEVMQEVMYIMKLADACGMGFDGLRSSVVDMLGEEAVQEVEGMLNAVQKKAPVEQEPTVDNQQKTARDAKLSEIGRVMRGGSSNGEGQ